MDAVLFDLDDTLCRFRVSGQAVLEQAFDAIGHEPCFTLADYHGAWDRHVGDADGLRELRRRCFTELVESAGHDRSLGIELERAYDGIRDPTDVEPLPGAREVVTALGEDYRLGLVTNGHPEPQQAKLAAIALEDHFETVVYGGYDVPPKPAPDPFERVLSTLDVAAADAVHIGNSLGSDVAGARTAGLRSVWLRQPDAPDDPPAQPDDVVDSLVELVELPWVASR